MIGARFKRQSLPRRGRQTVSRQNAVKECDVLFGFQEPRQPLVTGAMLLRHEGGALGAAAEADLSRIRIAADQKRLWPGASSTQAGAGDDQQYYRPGCHAVRPKLS